MKYPPAKIAFGAMFLALQFHVTKFKAKDPSRSLESFFKAFGEDSKDSPGVGRKSSNNSSDNANAGYNPLNALQEGIYAFISLVDPGHA